MMDLSVIVPIKDERDNLARLHDRVREALDPLGLDYELVLVDDGSIDGGWTVMEDLAARDFRVKVVRLRRNFGQSAALQAGIDHSSGAVIATMDGDLQNDPADIPMLLDKLKDGYDAVLGERARRQDGFVLRKIPSYCGNWLIRKVTGTDFKDLGCTLRVMRRDLAECLTLYGEMHRFIPVLAAQAGARMTQVPVRHHPRQAGKTKYNLTRTFRVILDLITVKFLHSYVTRPMHAMGFAGLISIGLGVVSLLAALFRKYALEDHTSLTRNPLLLLSVMLVVIGVQFISQGLLGEMMTRTYFESQGKPSYAVRTVLNLEKREQRRAA
jgi:glycosyltransferase involved in cell wall biosynthesis